MTPVTQLISTSGTKQMTNCKKGGLFTTKNFARNIKWSRQAITCLQIMNSRFKIVPKLNDFLLSWWFFKHLPLWAKLLMLRVNTQLWLGHWADPPLFLWYSFSLTDPMVYIFFPTNCPLFFSTVLSFLSFVHTGLSLVLFIIMFPFPLIFLLNFAPFKPPTLVKGDPCWRKMASWGLRSRIHFSDPDLS